MKENLKTDYIRFLLIKARKDLSKYNFTQTDLKVMNGLIERLIQSENLLFDLYVISNVKELKSFGKYLIFVLKKIEDNIISFDNLSQNLKADSEFIQNEILNFFSNPLLHETARPVYEEIEEEEQQKHSGNFTSDTNETNYKENTFEEPINKTADESDISEFKKNYLELIQTEAGDDENVYELPQRVDKGRNDIAFEIPEDVSAKEVTEEKISTGANLGNEISVDTETETGDEIFTTKEEPGSAKNKVNISEIEFETEENKNYSEEFINKEKEDNSGFEEIPWGESRIQLSDEIQEELNTYEEEQSGTEEIEENAEIQTTNAIFLEYENEIKEKNHVLSSEFDKMIALLLCSQPDEGERNLAIRNILVSSIQLENISRKMSLEVISNIYQAITLSFEKISEGRYDLSESTLNLFKKGLELVISLIKGDDYFGYKDILKSIENIRNALLEEKEKREAYRKQLKEKQEQEINLINHYPEDSQKSKFELLKKLIKDTEKKFNQIGEISGEYQIYEALRSLSSNLGNLKEIVKISKELNLKKLIQLTEASYIFLKFLQNYRINPVTVESKEVFGYIVYNLKSLVMGNETEDIDIFISYLNDPVKIFSKSGKKKT